MKDSSILTSRDGKNSGGSTEGGEMCFNVFESGLVEVSR